AEAPDRAHTLGDAVAEQFAHRIVLVLVAGRQHDEVGAKDVSALHSCAFGDKAGNVGELHEIDLAFDDEIGAADIEVIAAAAGEIFELPAAAVVAEVELEAFAGETVEQIAVDLLGLLGEKLMAP